MFTLNMPSLRDSGKQLTWLVFYKDSIPNGIQTGCSRYWGVSVIERKRISSAP